MTFEAVMRGYLVKEMFGPTLQGEGAHAGRPCVFLRFAVCNLACTWCDTDFRPEGARRLEADQIVDELRRLDVHGSRTVIVTGGEPTLHWDAPIADALRSAGFRTHMESNGTRPLRAEVDWLTFSPKPRFHTGKDEIVFTRADECKLVVDETIGDADFRRWSAGDYGVRFAQPCMDAAYDEHLRRTLALVARHPGWRLSLQLHKIIGLP
jgi:7-carboxy-7-deazaguanine synthase